MGSSVQDLPNEPTKAMGDEPDGLLMTQARHIATIENQEDAPFVFHRGVGRLIEDAPLMTIAFRGAVTVTDAGTLIVAWADADPGGELSGGGKRRRRSAHCAGKQLMLRRWVWFRVQYARYKLPGTR
jgi:hypothetical protein